MAESERPVIILHVEDDTIDSMVIERVLKKQEICQTLYKAKNGEEALDMLRGANGKQKLSPMPNVIILDINMPRMNGIEFLRELRKDPVLKSLWVFVLTTSELEEDITDCFEQNVAGYKVKPISVDGFDSAFETLKKYWALSKLPQVN